MSRWLPENISTFGQDVDNMFYFIYYLTGAVFILVAVAMIYFLIKYRDKGDGRRATYSHGNNTLEIIWTTIPAIIFIALGLSQERTWAAIKKNMPDPDLVVQLNAEQFNWKFTYAGFDGEFGTKDDYEVENRLRVPVDKNVHVLMEAKDVIHSFFVPQLRLKQDTVPGRTIPLWFNATKAGKYPIACAELCGFGHTTMAGELWVLDDAEWDAFVKKRLSKKK